MNPLATLVIPFCIVLGCWGLDAPRSPVSAASWTDTTAAAPTTQGQGSHGYSLRSLDGRHGFTYQGSSAGLGLIASTGRIDFDGHGNLVANYTTSVNGFAYTGTFTGTYTVNANGTGSITLNLPQPGMQAHGNFVLVDRGDESFFTSTDTGYSVVGRTRKM